MIFLNKILELDPMNVEAKLCKGEIYHRFLHDYRGHRAVQQGHPSHQRPPAGAVHVRARTAMAEIMEMLS